MRPHATTWMSLACLTGALFAVGCNADRDGELACMPTHELDYSCAPRVAYVPRDVPPPARPEVRPPAPLAEHDKAWEVAAHRPWKYIVIHHSASDGGNATVFDKYHREARGWDELGYHFVIDNGKGGPDGRVEVGGRWKSQKWGAHCGGTPNNDYNNFGIGICLVGKLDNAMPSAAQLAALRRLVRYLVLKYRIAPRNIIGHGDAPNARTDCPGKLVHTYIHSRLQAEMARELATAKR